MATFVFGSLVTFSLYLTLMVKTSEASCHGRELTKSEIKILKQDDPDKSPKFSDNFKVVLDDNCDFIATGCVEYPQVQGSFLMDYEVSRNDFSYGEEGIDGCNLLEEYSEHFGCIMKAITGAGTGTEFSAETCEIQANKICDHKCEAGDKVQPEKMNFAEGDTNLHLKVYVDGKLTELVVNMTLSKVG